MVRTHTSCQFQVVQADVLWSVLASFETHGPFFGPRLISQPARKSEVTSKVNLRSLPDSRRAGFGQDDSQRDAAFEPALAVARPHDGGDQHGDHDEYERAGDFIDAPEFEALFQPLVPVITA